MTRCRAARARQAGALAAIVLLAALPARAQVTRPSRNAAPDAAGATYDVAAVERALYAAVRRTPREPAARGALGAWLASRGQLRVGAVLLEEARLFGGSAPEIAARLVPVYTWLRDWTSLAALPASPLSSGEQAQARRLADLGTEIIGADSVEVAFAPLEVGTLGRVPMVIGRDTLWGEVDPQAVGLVLPGLASGAGLVEVLGDDGRGLVAIVRELSFGALTLRNLPARVDPTLGVGRARLGFDVFASLAPTVDGKAGTVQLRRAGRVEERAGATQLAMVLGFPGVRLALHRAEALAPMTSPAGRSALRGGRWTVDVRRGVIWVDAAR